MSINKLQNRKVSFKCGGFTLIEVLVALTILASGILGVLEAFSLCIQTSSHAYRLKEAADLARKELELATLEKPEISEIRSGTQGQYTWTMSFQDKECDLVLAGAVVNWSEKGQMQTFTLSRIILPQVGN